MRYLYGDSSESTLEINYLAFLRDAIDFGVAVLQADTGLSQARERRTQRERQAEEVGRALEQFGRVALDAVEPYAVGDGPVNRCAASLAATISETVKREVMKVRGGHGTDADQTVAELQRLREKGVAALGTLMATHDLPDADVTVAVNWTGGAFDARMVQRVGFGLEVTMALDVPPSSIFGHDLRVERVAEGVEVHAPESRGMLKKEVKMVPNKLGRHHVTHVTVSTSGVTVRVRATPEANAAGFDIMVTKKGTVTVERVGGGGADVGFDTDERDVAGLRNLAAKLEAAVDGLRGSRGALVSATLDGKALAAHEHPATLVQRLVSAMAPVVHEIARHSLSPRELVIKRLLGGDRREEIFLSRAELEKKIAALPANVQQVFAPLGIVEAAAPAPAPVAAAPAPSVTPAPSPAPAPAAVPVPAPESVEVQESREVVIEMEEPSGSRLEAPVIEFEAEAPPMPQSAPIVVSSRVDSGSSVITSAPSPSMASAAPPRATSPFPPASDLQATAAGSIEEPSGPQITIEAEPPPARTRPASLPSLPPLTPGGSRQRGKTVPPSAATPMPPVPAPTPTPAPRMSIAATEAAVDAALRDLDDQEPTTVVNAPPRPPHLE